MYYPVRSRLGTVQGGLCREGGGGREGLRKMSFVRRNISWTIIGRGWAKNRDLSEASRSIICRSRRLRQIIDLRDTDKSRYFAKTEFNNCFIIRSPGLSSYFNHFLAALGSVLPFFSRERGSNCAWAAYYLQQNTLRRYYAWADHYL